MKNYIKYSILLLAFVFTYSCSNDDEPVIPEPEPVVNPAIEIILGTSFTTNRYDVVKIEPEVTITDGGGIAATYQWSVKENGKDSIISDQKVLQFISPLSGEYNVDFTVTCGKTTEKVTTKVSVNTDDKVYNQRAVKVIDYLPAPFNFYSFFQYVGGDSKEGLIEYAQTEYTNGSYLDLGTFGGYIILQFDHTVINTFGKKDFLVECTNSKVPVAIQVAYDANKNGVADNNEWYEIAGSEYHKSTTVKDYEITYSKPDLSKEPVPGKYSWQVNTELQKWSDNKGVSGYITQTEWTNPDDYYPMWIGDSFTFKGTKLYLPVKDVSDGEGTKWNVGTFEWGYGGIKDSNIDINWAVDKDGEKVHLPGIDFVRLYNPVFTEIGVNGLLTGTFWNIKDLHLISEDKK